MCSTYTPYRGACKSAKITRKLKFQTTADHGNYGQNHEKNLLVDNWATLVGWSKSHANCPDSTCPVKIHKPRPCRHSRRRALAPINGITNQAEPPILTRRHSLLVGRPTRIFRDVDLVYPTEPKNFNSRGISGFNLFVQPGWVVPLIPSWR